MADPFAALGFVEDKADPFAGFQPDAPVAPSQADVRKSEPRPMPMEAFMERSKAFEDAMKRFTRETGGVLKPGQNIRQATAEWATMQDPEPDRAMAEIEHLAQGGDVQYGGSAAYNIAKPLAAVGGFAVKGPFGATGAEAVVRFTALSSNLKKAVDAGAITEDRAVEILAKEMATGMTEDAAWNVGVPLLGQLLAKIPGMRSIVAKVAAKLKPAGAALDTTEAMQSAAKVAARVDDATTPAAKKAVEELSKRTGPYAITPGQVTGEAGFGERVARAAGPEIFAKQEAALQKAAEGLREATVAPPTQLSREALGQSVQDIADASQKAMKARLRPTFRAANEAGVKVDFSDVLNRAKAALSRYEAVPGGSSVPGASKEVSALRGLVSDLEALAKPAQPAGAAASGLLDAGGAQIMKPTAAVPGQPPVVDAEAALDFISRQKAALRATTADWKPSAFYETVVNGLTKSADNAYETAVKNAGGAAGEALVFQLRKAQGQYRTMMETVYDDAVKAALKKNPEDVGRLFWQHGNVSEPKQLQRLLTLARAEGVVTKQGSEELSRAMTRGFLQEAVPNIDTAARWSTMLAEKPGLRDTWNALTAAPGGAELRTAMDVLANAAQIATRGSAPVTVGAVPIKRALGGGLGVSYVTGTLHPGMLATGIAVAPLTRAMSTAYATGNKGVLNLIARALRAQSAGTAAGAKALQAALPEIEKFAAAHGITDLFISERPEGAASEPEPQPQ